MTSVIITNKILITAVAYVTASLLHTRYSNHLKSPSSKLRPSSSIEFADVRDDVAEKVSIFDMTGYTDEAKADLITDLPRLQNVNFRQFSGYLTVSKEANRNIFYWYVESQNDPANDPVVFWTNGGPGCSGLLGFGTEHGPFIFTKSPKLLLPNPHSWNKVANMLYVEQPAGVGFSYTDDPKEEVGDARAAADNYNAIVEFLRKFPERRGNELYVSSESYGGHYIPQLTKEILKRNTDNSINFRGFLVGNPYVEPCSNANTQVDAYYSHGLIPKPLYDEWIKSCSSCDEGAAHICNNLMFLIFKRMGEGINPYAMDYPVCKEQEGPNGVTISEPITLSSPSHMSSQARRFLQHTIPLKSSPPFLPSADNYRPCAEAHFFNYLNTPAVRAALHVNEEQAAAEWDECSETLNYSETDGDTSQVDLYKYLVSLETDASTAKGLNMMVFSGDDDSICSLAGTQEWIYDLGVKPKKGKMWNVWTGVDGQTAGYVTKFELGEGMMGNFTFATVHGAGHEVPAYRPSEALKMFKSYFSGNWD